MENNTLTQFYKEAKKQGYKGTFSVFATGYNKWSDGFLSDVASPTAPDPAGPQQVFDSKLALPLSDKNKAPLTRFRIFGLSPLQAGLVATVVMIGIVLLNKIPSGEHAMGGELE